MPSNDLEEDLLRRFQALRSTPTTTPANPSSSSASFKHISDQQAKKAQEEDEELERIADGRAPASAEKESREGDSAAMEFARRMAKLRGVELEIEEDGEQEVNDFIASLSGNSAAVPPTTVTPNNEASRTRRSDTKSLEKEARDALKASSGYIEHPTKTEVDEGDGTEEDFETEDEILLRALEEAELEVETRSRDPVSHLEEEDDIAYEKETEQDILARARALAATQAQAQPQTRHTPSSDIKSTDEPELSFPALPTHIPIDESQDPLDKDAEARMALLLGLSGPSTKPGPPRLPSPPKDRKPGQGWNLPGYRDDRDEDPDSWCCICNKDADVVCLGCDDDPYCEECWVEGHVGERHRTKRYAGKGGRKAIGA